MLVSLAGAARAQSSSTTSRPTPDTSVTTRSTTDPQGDPATQQTRPPQQRQGVPPVTPVRPLSEEDRQRQQAASQRRQREAATGAPDVLLDVPNVSVEAINLEVDNLRAHLALDARLANLLQLTAGV